MKKNVMMKQMKRGMLIGVAVLSTFAMVGCSASSVQQAGGSAKDSVSYAEMSSEATYSYATEEYYEEGVYDAANGASASPQVPSEAPQENLATNRKLIQTVRLSVETENFTELVANVEDKVASVGGYISDAYTYNGSNYTGGKITRYADITIRIPESQLDAFVEEVGGISNVVEKTTSTEDVTLSYVDVEGKKNMYLAEEKSLLELLENATTIEDITFLTTRLTEVRYQIESMESTLRTYDNLVDYATIHLSVREVEVLTEIVEEEKGFWENLGERFMNSLENIAEFFVGLFELLVVLSPYLVVIAVIFAIIILAIRIIIAIIMKRIRKYQQKEQAKQNAAEEKTTQDNAVKDEKREEEKPADK